MQRKDVFRENQNNAPADAASNENFYGLGIAPGLLEVLEKYKFVKPTPIQYKAIPIAIKGQDLVGIAQTGTGKTLAFGIPMVQQLAQTNNTGLIVVPTRELAVQVNETIAKLTPAFKMKTAVLIGGQPMYGQMAKLKKKPRIIIATPGRLIDHLERKTVKLDHTRNVVLDEADRMLDMGFMPQLRQVLRRLPRPRQIMLFSATMPTDIVNIATSYMKMPVRAEIAPPGTATELVTQELFVVKSENKFKALSKLLKDYKGSVLLFARTKRGVAIVTRMLKNAGHPAAEIHSDRTMGQRKDALEGFKSGKYRILAATDIASRGIDVSGIELVINYDLPDDPENYVHRIGRTGRAGIKGHSITFATPDQRRDIKSIETMIKTAIPLSARPESEKFVHKKPVLLWSSKGKKFGRRR
ncbi:MAG: DEAD/DEAH box helicase [Candidatus Goldiibacteriota bacterium]